MIPFEALRIGLDVEAIDYNPIAFLIMKGTLEYPKKYGEMILNGGEINGMNGLIFAMASLKDMDGICLLGETAGYYVDALSSKEVLKSLAKLSGIEVDYSRLDSLAAEAEKAIKAMMEEISKKEEASRDTRPGRMDYIS